MLVLMCDLLRLDYYFELVLLLCCIYCLCTWLLVYLLLAWLGVLTLAACELARIDCGF